jgi:acyl-CoA reductase-like NAD-dependent aldehyde dehydrogenase
MAGLFVRRPRMSAKERGRVMYRLADLMERDREELAQLETLVGVADKKAALQCIYSLFSGTSVARRRW